MLTFKDFTKRLARAQLKNTSAVADQQDGEIHPDSEAQILELVNEGLEDLTMRMPILKNLITLNLDQSKNVYLMDESETAIDGTFLLPFNNNQFVGVLQITDSDGRDYQPKTSGQIMCPSHKTLRFSDEMLMKLGTSVTVEYQMKHPPIGEDDNIEIPPNLYNALQLFVASLYYSHMGSPEHTKKGDAYFATYLRHLNTDQTDNISQTSEVLEDTRFEDRGFV